MKTDVIVTVSIHQMLYVTFTTPVHCCPRDWWLCFHSTFDAMRKFPFQLSQSAFGKRKPVFTYCRCHDNHSLNSKTTLCPIEKPTNFVFQLIINFLRQFHEICIHVQSFLFSPFAFNFCFHPEIHCFTIFTSPSA